MACSTADESPTATLVKLAPGHFHPWEQPSPLLGPSCPSESVYSGVKGAAPLGCAGGGWEELAGSGSFWNRSEWAAFPSALP